MSMPAYSAGFALIENSASGMGKAFAGAAAAAEDASTVWFNPAGMTYLGKSLGISHKLLKLVISYQQKQNLRIKAHKLQRLLMPL